VCPADAGHTQLLQRIWTLGLTESWFCIWDDWQIQIMCLIYTQTRFISKTLAVILKNS
tara:strand:- start:11338 stop:11511 length:174 start_codon:yes stop_codon:yes gene_type:complete